MREIKFRAWDKKTNQMFQGWNLDGSQGDGEWSGGHFGNLEMQYSSISGFPAEELGRDGWDWREPDEIELMQFTGLRDANGVEIYEGDFLSDESLVKWCEMCVGFRPAYRYDSEDICHECDGNYSWHDVDTSITVIGNVHENPELLQ